MTIKDQLLLTNRTKLAIRDAIEARGVSVGTARFSEYADKVTQINSPPSPEDQFVTGERMVPTTPSGTNVGKAKLLPLTTVGSWFSFAESRAESWVAIGRARVSSEPLATPIADPIQIRDRGTLELIAVPAVPPSTASSMSFSRDDSLLAVGSPLRIIDTSDWTISESFSYPSSIVRFSSTADLLVAADDTTIRVLDTNTWSILTTVTVSSAVTWGEYSADGSRFAVATTASPYFAVYETTGWTVVSTPSTLPSTRGDCVAFSPDGARLGVSWRQETPSGSTNRARIYNVSTWGVVANLTWSGSAAPSSVSFSPTGLMIVGTTGSSAEYITHDGIIQNTYNGWSSGAQLFWARDGASVYGVPRAVNLAVQPFGSLYRFTVSPESLVAAMPLANATLTPSTKYAAKGDLALNPPITYQRGATSTYARGGCTGVVRPSTGQNILGSVLGSRFIGDDAVVSSTGRYIVAVGRAAAPAAPDVVDEVLLVDTVAETLDVHATTETPLLVGISPGGGTALVADDVSLFELRDTVDWSLVFTPGSALPNVVRVAAVTDAGVAAVACAGSQGVVRVFTPPSTTGVSSPSSPAGDIQVMAFSPDGAKLFCAAGDNRLLQVLDIASNTWVSTLTNQPSQVTSLVVADGMLIVGGALPLLMSIDDYDDRQFIGAASGKAGKLIPL